MISLDEKATASEVAGGWVALSARLTQAVDKELLRRVRDDVVAAIAPGAAGSAPACFYPGLARIEIDATESGEIEDPDAVDPRVASEREDIPVTWGMTIHEAAHATHTDWTDEAVRILQTRITAGTLDKAGADKIMEAALLLEEPRIEARHAKKHGADKRFLRLMFAKVIAGEVTADTTIQTACRVLCLTGGRQGAGVIAPSEGNKVIKLARRIVDLADKPDGENPAKYTQTEPFWYDTVWRWSTIAEDYSAAGVYAGRDGTRSGMLLAIALEATLAETASHMLRLAEQWLETLPKFPPPPDEDDDMDPFLKAILGAIAGMGDGIEQEGGWMPADSEFISPDWTPTWVNATAKQKSDANRLAKRLEGYVIPEHAGVLVSQAMPPGRLRTSAAIVASAQAARGAIPDAKPWHRIARKTIPTPPIKVGIAVDVSGSMSGIAEHCREIAFRFHSAFSRLPACTLRTILAGEEIHQMATKPGQIACYPYSHGQERIDLALKELTVSMGLLRPNTARLVIVISDAGFSATEERGSMAWCKKLLDSGCMVLWLDMDHGHYYYYRPALEQIKRDGAIFVKLSGDPAEAADMASDRLVEAVKNTTVALRRSAKTQVRDAPPIPDLPEL